MCKREARAQSTQGWTTVTERLLCVRELFRVASKLTSTMERLKEFLLDDDNDMVRRGAGCKKPRKSNSFDSIKPEMMMKKVKVNPGANPIGRKNITPVAAASVGCEGRRNVLVLQRISPGMQKLPESAESCGESKDENDDLTTFNLPISKDQTRDHWLLGSPLLRKSKKMVHGYEAESSARAASKMIGDANLSQTSSGTSCGYEDESSSASSWKSREANRIQETREDSGPSSHARMTVERVRQILAQVSASLSSIMDIEHFPAKYVNVERKAICAPSSSEYQELTPTSRAIMFQHPVIQRAMMMQVKNSKAEGTISLPQVKNVGHLIAAKGQGQACGKKEKNVPEKKNFLSHSSGKKSSSGEKRQRYEISNLRIPIPKDRYDQSASAGMKDYHDHGIAHFDGNRDESGKVIRSSPMRGDSRVKSKAYCIRDSKGRYRKVESKGQTAESDGVPEANVRKRKKKELAHDAQSMTSWDSTSRDSNSVLRWVTNIYQPFSPEKEGSGQRFCSSKEMEVIKKDEVPIDEQGFPNRRGIRDRPVTNALAAEKARKRKKQKWAVAELPLIMSSNHRAEFCRGSVYRLEEWDPPMSPFALLQESFRQDGWKVLLSSMLLNKASGRCVERIILDLFELCPNAESAVKMETERIANAVYSLGLQNKRAKMIQRFSGEYLRGDWINVAELHGIGKYATDCYALFYQGLWREVEPDDPMLTKYWNWIRQLNGLESSQTCPLIDLESFD